MRACFSTPRAISRNVLEVIFTYLNLILKKIQVVNCDTFFGVSLTLLFGFSTIITKNIPGVCEIFHFAIRIRTKIFCGKVV